MRLPRVKELTRKQAETYFRALLVNYPEFMEQRDTATVERRPTKRQRELGVARQDGYVQGYQVGQREQEAEIAKLKATLKDRQHQLENLKVARDFLSAAGQTIDAYTRALMSQTPSQGSQL